MLPFEVPHLHVNRPLVKENSDLLIFVSHHQIVVMNELYIKLLIFSFCRGKQFMYQVIEETIDAFPDWLQQVINYASSASFITMLFCILG